MPGKSRHGKGKHPHHSKKSKIKQRQASMPFQQHVAAEAPDQIIAAVKHTPEAVTPSPAKTKTMLYPYIIGELRRIGILAVITLVILIVLALVLS